MSENEKSAIRYLRSMLTRHCHKDKFDSKSFVADWLKDKGSNYIFIFKKNISHTNIQYAELISLIRECISCKIEEPDYFKKSVLMFHRSDEIDRSVKTVMHDLIASGVSGFDAAEICADTYHDLMFHSIAIDSYYCSCNVALPPYLELDLERLCALSSYIHSCGPSVFIENIDRTTEEIICEKLHTYLTKLRELGTSVINLPFIPYTHEDFSPTDLTNSVISEQISNGIDGIKLRIGKLNVENNSLSSVLRNMQVRFHGKIKLLRPGEVEKHKYRGAMWLITDYSIDDMDHRRKGSSQYYICYDQHYYNDSPFDIFDEDKPAWKAHTTTPHLLIGAMINCSKPWCGNTKVIDPFGGTGTTFFESLRHVDLEIVISDIDPTFKDILFDNLSFLAADIIEIEICREKLLKLLTKLTEDPDIYKHQDINSDTIDTIITSENDADVKETIDPVKVMGTNKEWRFIEFQYEQSQKLRSFNLYQKLIFYILLRSNNRYYTAIGWGAKTQFSAFIDECRVMIQRLDEYKKWIIRQDKLHKDQEGSTANYLSLQGKYSYSTSINKDIFAISLNNFESMLEGNAVIIRDATNLEDNTCDIIIADPPYGINAGAELRTLVKLYSDLIPNLISSLKPNGQLLMCLPMKSYTGKSLPHCALKDFVIPEILMAAEKKGRRVVNYGQILPEPFGQKLTPYYWVAEKALGRWILHFQFS